jgi:arylformamidase
MIFEKSVAVKASPEQVWKLLLDPNVMGACVPGVEKIEVVSDVEYIVSVQVKITFITARFTIKTKIVETRPPAYLKSVGTGQDSGMSSSMTQTSEVFIADLGNGQSELKSRLNVELLGKFGSFGLNIIKTKVDRMWEEFSQNLARRLEAPAGEALPIVASTPAPASSPAAQPASEPAKGTLVWLDMDQEALDKAYNQAAYAVNRQQMLDRYISRSDITRAIRGEPLRKRYGPSEIEGLDIYRAPQEGAPINIFIHGGAWKLGFARECGMFADLFNEAGAHLVVPDFTSVEQVGGDLFPMVEQVRRAIAWVVSHAKSFGGDPKRIYLSGTSSGAHLAAVALTSDWSDYGLPRDAFKGALLCSGIYDLEPVRRSARSSYVRITDEAAQKLSPQHNLHLLSTPLVVVYGSLETPEFKRQSKEFAEAVDKAGYLTELQYAEGYNHFEIHETLGDPYDVLGRAVLRQMGLSTRSQTPALALND